MAKHTISTLSPVTCDSFGATDKYGQSVQNAMATFSAYPVIVEKVEDHWVVTPISHFHLPEHTAKPTEVTMRPPPPNKTTIADIPERGRSRKSKKKKKE